MLDNSMTWIPDLPHPSNLIFGYILKLYTPEKIIDLLDDAHGTYVDGYSELSDHVRTIRSHLSLICSVIFYAF